MNLARQRKVSRGSSTQYVECVEIGLNKGETKMNWRNWTKGEIGWFSGSTLLEKRVECFDDEVKVICLFCISNPLRPIFDV